MITLLNTSIITAYGSYQYEPLSLETAISLVSAPCPSCLGGCPVCNMAGKITIPFQSAIGHQATADILSDLLGVPVAVNRINYAQENGDVAVVFKLRGRAPEGTILSRNEVEQMGYDFGLLTRTA